MIPPQTFSQQFWSFSEQTKETLVVESVFSIVIGVWIGQLEFFKRDAVKNGVRRTPPRKIPPCKTPARKISPRQIPPWWIPPRNILPSKTPPRKTPPYSFLKLFLLKKCCSSWKSDFLFTREINKNIYNRLYLFVNKIDYLPNTFNINKMHSNKDLDLIQPVVCKCWYCHWDLFCNRYQQWSIHFTARFSNYLK